MAALRVAVTRTQFSRIENGDSLLSAAEVIALAAVLAMSYDWLLDGKLRTQS
jgi:transcriptional regulator with XRE-family HTH domain